MTRLVSVFICNIFCPTANVQRNAAIEVESSNGYWRWNDTEVSNLTVRTNRKLLRAKGRIVFRRYI